MPKNIRISGYIDPKLKADIDEISDRDDRSLAKTISNLLRIGVNERNRKRKSKAVSSEKSNV